jgi:hypothetical protein
MRSAFLQADFILGVIFGRNPTEKAQKIRSSRTLLLGSCVARKSHQYS